MKRTLIQPDFSQFPEAYLPLLGKYPVYDSSCSQGARVWFIEGEGGFYLKTAAEGSLNREAQMTRFFHSKGLGAEVLSYASGEKDWLLTRAIPGEDCTHRQYLDDPRRLCDTTATLLRQLHETDLSGCPVIDRCGERWESARKGYEKNFWEPDLFAGIWEFSSMEEAWAVTETNGKYLKNEVLLHGDYCLPNVMLDNWRFSGFIDLGSGGLGDRHFDLLWGSWTLKFNLGTDAYCSRFLDAYGRDKVEPELLRTTAAIEIFG